MAAIAEAVGNIFKVTRFPAVSATDSNLNYAGEPTEDSDTTDVHDYNEYTEALETALALVGDNALESTERTAVEANLAVNRIANADALSIEIKVPTRVSLLELGFAPVFYSFVDTIIEVKIAISMSRSGSSRHSTRDKVKTKSKEKQYVRLPFIAGKKSKKKTISTSQVNASYSSRYSYSAEGSSLLRTKLAPVPTPPLLEERIRALLEAEQDRQQARLQA